MKDIDRDMYYGGYGYSGFSPMGAFPNQMPGTIQSQMASSGMPNSYSNMPNNYSNSWYNDINERLERLERQVKRLDQRLTRLETPYANSSKYNNEPDNNMYMM